ncbi:MAG: methionine gamma-lyase family protein [Clostridia bacterium]|nr:methionine gamma-lyase family protein [Clostridia bacterium]
MKLTAGKIIEAAEKELAAVFGRMEAVELTCARRVLGAFRGNRVAARHFNFTTGYGYDDEGRDALDRIFAEVFETEAALVVPQFSSGTQTIFTALSALLRPGDTLLCATGSPYDTLLEAIGIEGNAPGSLREFGVSCRMTELTPKGEIDLITLAEELAEKPKIVYFQRSRGYAWRNSLLPEGMKPAFDLIKERSPESIIMVDNCYGEFTREHEPTAYGADIIMGSLIKNPGAGIAQTGGYIAGRRDLIDICANRVTVPGIGREAGCWPAGYLPFYQGIFMAPHVVCQALKNAALFARVFEKLGLMSMPSSEADRSDIVQALRFNRKEQLTEFCRVIQSVSPVDSFVVPEPWAMPGYTDEVIMAAGAFVQGSSIELSADGPIREPYTAYIQGGLTYSHGRIAAEAVLDSLMKDM